ncbi:MAG: carbohydrate porin [Mariprofundaceae bacterium]|nr:carbohydrate porin [Mariprofundaceae bacterium]
MMLIFRWVTALSLMSFCVAAQAETVVEYGLTAGVQGVSKDTAKLTSPAVSSVDLIVDMDLGGGVLHFFIEGASSATGTVEDVVSGANADIGSAADKDGNGRLQLSELSYAIGFSGYDIAVGMQDLFAFVDANSTANAETDQFMAGSLVNNPTIAMPDYTMSAVLNYGYKDKTNFTVMLANAYGLADNASVDYADLVDFGTTEAGLEKGTFALGELRMEDQDVWLSLASWINTKEQGNLLGGYVNLDSASAEDFAWSTRFGWNDSEDGVGSFMSVSTAFAYGDDTLGVGLAWHRLVATLGSSADPLLTEVYYRWQLTDSIALTPDLQWWSNANELSKNVATVTGGDVIIYGLRLQYADAVSY